MIGLSPMNWEGAKKHFITYSNIYVLLLHSVISIYILLRCERSEINNKVPCDMKAKIGKRGDAEQINYITQTKPDKVHVLKLYEVQIRKT